MGQQYSTISYGTKKDVDRAVQKVKDASDKHGFNFYRLDQHKWSDIDFHKEEDCVVRLNGCLNIEQWVWGNNKTFHRELSGTFKPLFLTGYYEEDNGVIHELSKSDKSDIGKIEFKKCRRHGDPHHLKFDDFRFKCKHYECMLPKHNVVLYLVGEAPFLAEEDENKSTAGHVAQLHLAMHLTCSRVKSLKDPTGKGEYTTFKPTGDLSALQVEFVQSCWIAGAIVYESASMRHDILKELKELKELKKRYVERFITKFKDAVKGIDDITNTVKKDEITFKDKLVVPKIKLDKCTGYLQETKSTGKRWNLVLNNIEMEDYGNEKESFAAFVVGGYISVDGETYMLSSKDQVSGAVHIRHNSESYATKEEYEKEYKSDQKVENKERRDLSLCLNFLDLLQNNGQVHATLAGKTGYGQLGLLLYGNGRIGGKDVTVMRILLHFNSISEEKETGLTKYTFTLSSHQQDPQPFKAYFKVF